MQDVQLAPLPPKTSRLPLLPLNLQQHSGALRHSLSLITSSLDPTSSGTSATAVSSKAAASAAADAVLATLVAPVQSGVRIQQFSSSCASDRPPVPTTGVILAGGGAAGNKGSMKGSVIKSSRKYDANSSGTSVEAEASKGEQKQTLGAGEHGAAVLQVNVIER